MENRDRIKFFRDRKIIAIDPGNNGGIVIYSVDKQKVIDMAVMPPTMQEIAAFIKIYSKNSVCYIEKVGGLPGMSGSAMFNFGNGVGHLQMLLFLLKIPTVEVTPQRWQKELQLGTRGNKTKTFWKNKLKSKAQTLFPYVGKITLATSDSLLICEYARRQENLK
nr:MAG TPA: HOLLIDAY JUNCTION RESOLVASE [Caudoviricetes sp.]